MTRQMILAGLKARPVRTTVSVLAVALEVVLILVIVGLTTGITGETAKRTAGVGGEITIQPPNSGAFLALTANSMPVAIADKVRELPNVKAVTPIQVQVNSQAGVEMFFGIDVESWNQVSGGFQWHAGRMFEGPEEIVVDDLWAKSKNATIGDEVEVLNHKFRVSGIVEHGKGARVFMPMKTTEELSGEVGRAGVFYVKLNEPAQVQETLGHIKGLLPGYTIRDVQDLATLMTSSNIPGLNAFINAVVLIALCVGVLVIFLSMYTTITERTREIGILRSLGASRAFIVGLILQESIFICAIGVVFGIASSFLLAELLRNIFATLMIEITPGWVLKASVFAVLSGIIGSFYPSLKAAKQDPVEALAYE
jgi:putative ABC transport system permease protein